MADSKITALTALTAADPVNDMFPIVDVSDTTMAASGTTKKISVNNILGASGTATLASATITGDLTVDTNVLKVDSTLNKVGIGVATLTGLSTLNVAGDVAITSDLVLKNGSGTAQGYIFGSSGINYRVIASNPHVWQEGGTDLMRLNATGLGIGTSPATKLDVLSASAEGTIRLTSTIDGSNASPKASSLSLRSGSASVETARIASFNRFANVGGGDLVFSTADTSAVLQTRATIDSSGNLLVGVTSANANGGVLQLKSGITFPATQVAASDANTLDDYEEGTFTATLTGGTTNPTIPVTTTGRYTKVGRIVTVQIGFENVITTGASGLIGVTGLPFANNSNVLAVCPVSFYSMATFTGSPFGNIGLNESFINFFSNNSNAIFSDATHNAGITRFLRTTATYQVA